MMKLKYLIIIFICATIFSCSSFRRPVAIHGKTYIAETFPLEEGFINDSPSNFSYTDFPCEDSTARGITMNYVEHFADGRARTGRIINGFKQNKWTTDQSCFVDSCGNQVIKNYLYKEEYFKNGLRDSIYRIYNKDHEIIYDTYFEMGTGLVKDYYPNGQLYYEITTKDGYFDDTLKLYNEKGRIKEKILYQKDSLVYDLKLEN